jgi:hypothetical protein
MEESINKVSDIAFNKMLSKSHLNYPGNNHCQID